MQDVDLRIASRPYSRLGVRWQPTRSSSVGVVQRQITLYPGGDGKLGTCESPVMSPGSWSGKSESDPNIQLREVSLFSSYYHASGADRIAASPCTKQASTDDLSSSPAWEDQIL